MVNWSDEDHFACNKYNPLLIKSILSIFDSIRLMWWWEEYLSKRSPLKHTCSWRVNLLYYEYWTDKQKYYYTPILLRMMQIIPFLRSLNRRTRNLRIFSLHCRKFEVICNLTCWWLPCIVWLFNNPFDSVLVAIDYFTNYAVNPSG